MATYFFKKMSKIRQTSGDINPGCQKDQGEKVGHMG